MNKKIFIFIPYVIALAIIFYALPFLISDTGSGMLFLLLIIPLLTFACSIVYGIRQGFNIFFTFITVILFVPTIFIFYNSSAWIYIVVYGIISIAGNLIVSCDELWDNGETVKTPFDGLMAFGDATTLWGLNESTLRKAITYGKLTVGTDVCKYGKQWVITVDAMYREYGQPKGNFNLRKRSETE